LRRPTSRESRRNSDESDEEGDGDRAPDSHPRTIGSGVAEYILQKDDIGAIPDLEEEDRRSHRYKS
jgi:hypothetical protein